MRTTTTMMVSVVDMNDSLRRGRVNVSFAAPARIHACRSRPSASPSETEPAMQSELEAARGQEPVAVVDCHTHQGRHQEEDAHQHEHVGGVERDPVVRAAHVQIDRSESGGCGEHEQQPLGGSGGRGQVPGARHLCILAESAGANPTPVSTLRLVGIGALEAHRAALGAQGVDLCVELAPLLRELTLPLSCCVVGEARKPIVQLASQRRELALLRFELRQPHIELGSLVRAVLVVDHMRSVAARVPGCKV